MIRVLRIALITVAVQILAPHDATNLVIVLPAGRLRRLLVGIAKNFSHDSPLGFLRAYPQLLRNNLRALLRSRVFIRMQLPIKPIHPRPGQR
ncbi:hypothetical protein VL15_04600, partial [Burkholderia cepacia]